MGCLLAVIATLMEAIPFVIITLVVFLINPVMGVLVGLFFISIVVITAFCVIRKDLVMKFLGWIFGERKDKKDK